MWIINQCQNKKITNETQEKNRDAIFIQAEEKIDKKYLQTFFDKKKQNEVLQHQIESKTMGSGPNNNQHVEDTRMEQYEDTALVGGFDISPVKTRFNIKLACTAGESAVSSFLSIGREFFQNLQRLGYRKCVY